MDYNRMTKEELIDKLRSYESSPLLDIYVATQTQLKNIAKEIKEANIPFEEGNKLFEAFIKWGKESLTISENLEKIKQKLDPEELKRVRKDKTEARVGSVESFKMNK